MIIKIVQKRTGNCQCMTCGRLQEGWKMQPFTVWYKAEGEKRGHNVPFCSLECAQAYADKIRRATI